LIEDTVEARGSKEAVVEEWMKANEKKKTAFYDRLGELPEDWQRRFRALPDKRSSALQPFTEDVLEYARELIEDFPILQNKSRAWMIKDWAVYTNRVESDFPALLKTLGSDWEKRFLALPA
jgi:hypothetical protein